MFVHLDEDEFRGYLHRIVSAVTEEERSAAADALVIELHTREALQVWGRHLALHYGRAEDGEEFTSVITEALLRHTRSLTVDDLERVHTVGSYLYFRGKGAVQKWLDSPAVTIAIQMSGISRRHRMARAAIKELYEVLGQEPETHQVVDYVNTRALSSRKDAVKQGALISAEDVEGAKLRALSMDYSAGDGSQSEAFGNPDDGRVTLRAEVSLTVGQLASRAVAMFGDEEGAQVKLTLELWVNLVLAKEPVTITAVSNHFGVSLRTAKLRLQRVNMVMDAFRNAHESSQPQPDGGVK